MENAAKGTGPAGALPYKVTNYRKSGEIFDPKGFRVSRADHPEIYAIIDHAREQARKRATEKEAQA